MKFTSSALPLLALSTLTSAFVLPAAIPGAIQRISKAARGISGANLEKRTTPPYFPAEPASCPKCEAEYWSLDACAQAAPVLANVSMVLFNPSAFVDAIQCACTETFQDVFPQCVDCFQRTNQTDVLDTPDLGSVLSGMREICALASTLFGNVASDNGELSQTATSTPSPTPDLAAEGAAMQVTGFNALALAMGSVLLPVALGAW
ncbi:hypothetical protein BDV98DRAFT_570478 [Pterulicium gracile]|uniref:Uncharacterized protein n=1 Tax=Pterulicium gracile TaxID=1884261 RepID=A0A5C3QFD5_9AGAR|nr:hypothetical protein BDV98DRAFT_570478 [Pterula gracilis]